MRYCDPMPLDTAINATRTLVEAGAPSIVEVGAVEPLLWTDGRRRIADLVRTLSEEGFQVSVTTNGSRLRKEAVPLSRSGVHHINVSWHTTNQSTFQQITGGGDYSLFIKGVSLAIQSGLRISFNRVLLRGFEGDVPEQLDFIQNHGLKIKLYDLLWTPDLADIYDEYYIGWNEVIDRFVAERTAEIRYVKSLGGRNRIQYYLSGGGVVEVKNGTGTDRSNIPCSECGNRQWCLEALGDYLRVMPDGALRLCYLRRDISVPLRDSGLRGWSADWLVERLNKFVPDRAASLLAGAKIRLIVTPYCNFNCCIPGTAVRFCHKSRSEFQFPERAGNLLVPGLRCA